MFVLENEFCIRFIICFITQKYFFCINIYEIRFNRQIKIKILRNIFDNDFFSFNFSVEIKINL